MATFILLYGLLYLFHYTTASFFEVQYPSVIVSSETNGNVSIVAGPQAGNIFMKPGLGGTVYIGKTDMLKLFEMVDSLPPIWSLKSAHGSLGSFLGGTSISLYISAQDPEGSSLKYEKISGALPPGVHLNPTNGHITGVAPDVDATYEFGVRVTDKHGKYADQTFTIDTREKDQCKSSPCRNGGTCTDEFDTYNCTCSSPYGGKSCEINCASKAVGVAYNLKYIPDAHMSGHYSYSSSSATDGRLGSSSGWRGESTSSWLQIDLGEIRDVHAVSTQGYSSSSYYITTYRLRYSVDGNTFSYVQHANRTTATFQGSGSSYSTQTKQTLPVPVRARFIRFRPQTWGSATKPGMRVEVYACKLY